MVPKRGGAGACSEVCSRMIQSVERELPTRWKRKANQVGSGPAPFSWLLSAASGPSPKPPGIHLIYEARVSCRFLIGSALGDPPSPGPRIGASLLLIGGGGGPVGSLLLLELLSPWKRIGLLCECGKGSVSEGIRRASLLGPPVSLPERGRVSVGGRSTLHPNDKGSWLTPTPS